MQSMLHSDSDTFLQIILILIIFLLNSKNISIQIFGVVYMYDNIFLASDENILQAQLSFKSLKTNKLSKNI